MKRNSTKTEVEILIVEDSPTQAEKLKFILEQHGYNLSMVRNGREALAAIARHPPTLVISDIMMPEMDGYQLCRQIKQEDKLKMMPVILLTSLSEPMDVMKGLESGADSFIFKPYEEEYLLARVAYTLANQNLRESEYPRMGVEIFFAGRKFFITSDRLQILNLLLSTYEAAVQKNRDLAAAQAELARVNEELIEASRHKSEFLANMSHELRTPLNSIIGFTEFIIDGKSGPLNEKQKAQLEMVHASGAHLLNLINDLLDLSKIEAGKAELNKEWFSLKSLVEEVFQTVAPMALRKNLALAHELEIPERIYTDQRMVFQVLLNLVNNALKFTESGGVKVAAVLDDGKVRITVADTGIGMKPESVKMLFEAFRQVDASSTRRYEGTGLGLYLCKRLLSLLGGDISAESDLGKGSHFTITIPFEGVQA